MIHASRTLHKQQGSWINCSPMAQRTVLKVSISCDKCKKKLLKSISSLQGVDKMEVDVTKGTLAITGSVDPYEVIVKARKAGRHAEVVTIGPPPKKPIENNSDDKKPIKCPPYLWPYPMGEIVFVELGHYNEPIPLCSIM